MSVEERLTEYLTREAESVVPMGDLLDRVKARRARRTRRMSSVAAALVAALLTAGISLAIVHRDSSASPVGPGPSSTPLSSEAPIPSTLPGTPTVTDTRQPVKLGYQTTPPAPGVFAKADVDLRGTNQLSVPWALVTSISSASSIDVVSYGGDGYCVKPIGYHVRESASSVEVWAIDSVDPVLQSCPANLNFERSRVPLAAPLGDRTLLHAPIDPSLKDQYDVDTFGPQVVAAPSSPSPTTAVDFPRSYASLSELAKGSSAVLVATATSDATTVPGDTAGTSGLDFSVSHLQVNERLAGDYPDPVITLRQLGTHVASPSSSLYVIDGGTLPIVVRAGTTYVLFVTPFHFEDVKNTGQYALTDWGTLYELQGDELTYVGMEPTRLPKTLTLVELKAQLRAP
jgi:hypothetical protein